MSAINWVPKTWEWLKFLKVVSIESDEVPQMSSMNQITKTQEGVTPSKTWESRQINFSFCTLDVFLCGDLWNILIISLSFLYCKRITYAKK